MTPAAAVTLRCLCGAQVVILLSPLAIPAYVNGPRFAPSVPIPDGWTAYANGAESAFECAECGGKHADLLTGARAAR